MENDVLYNRIMNVVHEEYGEGSTAVANPEGEATDDLEKIQIGDEIYGISGGGDGGTLVLHMVTDGVPYHLDQTYKTIRDAFTDGKMIVLIQEESDGYYMWFVSAVQTSPLSVVLFDPINTDNLWLNALSENDYPIWED